MSNKSLTPMDLEWLKENTCLGPLSMVEKYREQGKIPDKFPEMCRNCWKVLVFDVHEKEALYIREKYPDSKHKKMKGEPNKFFVVIYTRSEDERDNVRRALEIDNRVMGRIRYRFACKLFQDNFPEMFISTGKPNPKFL